MTSTMELRDGDRGDHGDNPSTSPDGAPYTLTLPVGAFHFPGNSAAGLQGVDEVTIDRNTSQCVCTPDLEEAEELLDEAGQVVLCGPPGCGKSTLGLALLGRSKKKGFTPHIITTLEGLNSTDLKTSFTRGGAVLLLDGTLGTVRVDRRQHDLWTAKRPGLMELVDQGRCRLIITLYPHVLREVRRLECEAHSPLSDRSLVVQMENTLDPEVKKQMLNFYLEELQLDQAEHNKVVETVLQTDRSGPGFPWCCHRLAKHWSSYKDLAVFSAPEETHFLLFDEMVTHPIHGRRFAAVLALTMRGFHGFLHRPGQAQPELTRLGFKAFTDDQLAEYADVLRGSVLTEDGKNYASRVLYDAAALALGRSFRLPTMLRACDVKFLVQHVQTTQIKPRLHLLENPRAAQASETIAQIPETTDAQIPETADAQIPETTDVQIPEKTDAQIPETTDTQIPETTDAYIIEATDPRVSERTESNLSITVGLPVCSSASLQGRTTSEDLRLLLDRVYEEMTSGHLPEISQHPSLQCPEFLLALERYCEIHGHSVQQLVSVVDPVHGLPQVYWSVFSRSHTLTQWCLTHMTQTQSGLKLLSPPVLLACAVFDQLAGNSSCRLQSWLKDTLTPNHFSYKTDTVELPLLAENQRLTGDSQQYLELIIGSESPDRDVHYLCDRSLPIPVEVIKVQVSGEKVRVKVGDRRLWYLAQRLIADREVNRRDREGNTLLHAALNMENTAIIQLAVKGGGSLLYRNTKRKTVYQAAQAKRGWLKWKRDSNVAEYFSAIRSGDIVKVKTLLCLGVSVEERGSDGHIGLYVACKAGHRDIADLLVRLGRGASMDRLFTSFPCLLKLNVLSDNTSAAHRLIYGGADTNLQDENRVTPLHFAAFNGNTDTVDLLLHCGANANVQNKYDVTPLHLAAQQGRTDTADVLLRHEADINMQEKNGLTPLHLTAIHGRTDTADCLINHGASITVQERNGSTPLHYAALQSHADAADCLIKHGANINVQDRNGSTPLHYASLNGNTDTADCLIKRGANIIVQERNGLTPLHYTALNGHTDTADCLIKHGANINAQSTNGSTPLFYAAQKGQKDTADLLLCRGANVNAQNKHGFTPLHRAAESGHTDTVDLLLRHEADINMHNKNGLTPLHCAAIMGHTDTVDFSIKHGANINALVRFSFTFLQFNTDPLVRFCVNMAQHFGKSFTPLYFADVMGHRATADCLIKHGATLECRIGKFVHLFLTRLNRARRHN